MRSATKIKRVCVIEDTEGLNVLIQRKLTSAGFNCIGLLNEKEVMQFAFEETDLLLLDYDLGGVHAGELLDQLNAKNIYPHFVVLTGRGDEKSAVEMMKKGARDYLVKTFEVVDLLPAAVGRTIQEIENEALLSQAQERLLQREQQLAKAQRLANVGSFEWYFTTREIDLSPEFYRIMKWTEGAEPPGPFHIMHQIHPADRHAVVKQFLSLLRSESHLSINFRMSSKETGTFGIFRLEAETRTRNRDNKPSIEVVGIVHDVSQQVAIEQQLLRYQDQLESLVQERTRELVLQRDFNEALIRSTPDPLFAFDQNSTITRCNPAFAELLNMHETEIPGQTLRKIVPEHLTPELNAALPEVLGGHSVALRALQFTPDGRFYDVLLSSLHGEDGSITGGLVFLHDVTETKANSEVLKRSEERLRLILETIPVPMVVLRANDNVVLFANPAFQPLIAADMASIHNKSLPLFSDDVDRRLLRHALETEGFLFNYEMQIKNGKGNTVWVLLSAQRILLEKEEAWLASMVDITERKTAEGQLTQALASLKDTQAQLIHSEKLAFLGGLTAGIAHEIKNPLNFINNFSILSADAAREMQEAIQASFPKTPRVKEISDRLIANLEIITRHGKRIDSIVRNMLMHSRGQKGDFQEVKINDLVEESVQLAYHGMRASGTDCNAELQMNLAANTGTVNAIPQDLGRVFVNLATNAFQAMIDKQRLRPGYSPLLTVTTERGEACVLIHIRDNGPGIARENLDRLFTPFFTTKAAGSGTGLGLSLSYEIITNVHKGEISAQSVEGEWTEFTIKLNCTEKSND